MKLSAFIYESISFLLSQHRAGMQVILTFLI